LGEKRARQDASVIACVKRDSHPDFLEIGNALDRSGLANEMPRQWEQQPGQNRDDPDDNEQFRERESVPPWQGLGAGKVFHDE
jgi:hypothetical protein